MEKQKVSVKMGMAYQEAVAHMKALVEGLETGTILVESGEESVTLTPSEHIEIKVEAKTKKDKQKFSFELSWTNTEHAGLKISDKAPGTSDDPTESGDSDSDEDAPE